MLRLRFIWQTCFHTLQHDRRNVLRVKEKKKNTTYTQRTALECLIYVRGTLGIDRLRSKYVIMNSVLSAFVLLKRTFLYE